MALVIHCYDFLCFAIVLGAILCSFLIISGSEYSGTNYETTLHLAAPRTESTSNFVGWGQLWTSCWRGVRPQWLLATRLFSFVFMVAILTWDITTFGSRDFLYYTEWTFTLVIIYFAIATLISAHGCWIYAKRVTLSDEANGLITRDVEENNPAILTFRVNKNRDAVKYQSHCGQDLNEQRAGFWGYAMQIVYQTSAGAVTLTDIVFWGIIAPFLSIEHFKLNTIMVCMHSLNVVFLLLDTVLNNLPFPWFRIAYFVLWSCIYVIFQWVLHSCGFSWWPYPFLELSTPWAPLWYFCLAFLHLPCYSLYCLIVTAKESILAKLFPCAFKGRF